MNLIGNMGNDTSSHGGLIEFHKEIVNGIDEFGFGIRNVGTDSLKIICEISGNVFLQHPSPITFEKHPMYNCGDWSVVAVVESCCQGWM